MNRTVVDLSTFDLTDDTTLEGATRALLDLRKLKIDLRTLEAGLESFLADVLPGGGLDMPGVGFFEVRHSPVSPKTDGRMLAHKVAAQVADEVVDRETGEVPPLGVVVARVADAVMECAGIDNESHSWRSGQLKKRGIDLKDYRRSDGWRTSVVIRDSGST